MSNKNPSEKDEIFAASELLSKLSSKAEMPSASGEPNDSAASDSENELDFVLPEPKDSAPTADEVDDSEIDVSELLRKYLPEFAEEDDSISSALYEADVLLGEIPSEESVADDADILSEPSGSTPVADADPYENIDPEMFVDPEAVPEEAELGFTVEYPEVTDPEEGEFVLGGSDGVDPDMLVEPEISFDDAPLGLTAEYPEADGDTAVEADAEKDDTAFGIAVDLPEVSDPEEGEFVPEPDGEIDPEFSVDPDAIPADPSIIGEADGVIAEENELSAEDAEAAPSEGVGAAPSGDDLLARLRRDPKTDEYAHVDSAENEEEPADAIDSPFVIDATVEAPSLFDEVVDAGNSAEDGETIRFSRVVPPSSDTEEMDRRDIELMLAFGMDDELNRTMGAEAAAKLARELEAEQEKSTRSVNEYEFTDRSQIPQIADAYSYTKRSLTVKTVIALLITLYLFFYENITLFGIQFAGFFDPAVYPVVYIMGSLQLLLLVAAVAYEQVIFGFKRLFTFRPTPESISAAGVAFAVIFSALSAFNLAPNTEPKMYNFPVAVCTVITLLYSLINTKREIYSFNIVSSKRDKFAVTHADGDGSEVGAEDEDGGEIMVVKKSGFIDGFFSRTYDESPSVSLAVGITLALSAVAGALIAALTALRGGDAPEIISAAYMAIFAVMPVSLLVTFSYPLFLADRQAFAMDSTLIGEGALTECKNASVICFDDNTLFTSKCVKVQNIRIYNNRRIDRVLYYASSVFNFTAGPLSEVFEVATADIGHSSNVSLINNSDGILDCMVDDSRVILGSAYSLGENGIAVPADVSDEDQYASPEISIMYMFIDGVLSAKMYVKYTIDADFEFTLSDLEDNGLGVCIYTSDPNISEEMIRAQLHFNDLPVKVSHYSADENFGGEEERVDSGIVSRNSPKYLMHAVTLAEKVRTVRRMNVVLASLSMALAVILMAILAASGKQSSLLSVYIAAYQLVWMLPGWLTSKLFIS